MLRIAGIAVGAPLEANSLDVIKRRLEDSGFFSTIDVRKRYRSLTDANDVALVLVVHEKTGVVANAAGQIERPDHEADHEPRHVSADPQLRGRLRPHLRRALQHRQSARRRRTPLRPALLGRHTPRRARGRAHVQARPSHQDPRERDAPAARQPGLRPRPGGRRRCNDGPPDGIEGARRTQLRKVPLHRCGNHPGRGGLRTARHPGPVDGRRRRGARHARESQLPLERDLCGRRLERPAPRGRRRHEPLHR